MTRTRFDETESEFYLRVQNLRAAQWIYLSADERQAILEYLASFRRIEHTDPALKDRLRDMLEKAAY
jgi:hypothetical protein